ncbi:hypothetical protein CSKR_100824 [Clonorchis sinensis]|uniref:Uncharacterized protein n=1 Tax=Clonorchis sinensis TaxID=79923 RepID=A0A419QG63_CLOSI|nr:hypothetical protein CSKR_100824 [Clonorchis sinensis]
MALNANHFERVRLYSRVPSESIGHYGRILSSLSKKCPIVHYRGQGTRWSKWLEREFTDRKVRNSNPNSASRLPLSRLGQPGSSSALVLPSGGMAVRHRKGATAERYQKPELV